MNAQPFVKWAGGKRKLLPELFKAKPKSFNRYLEPFLGGGAFAIALGFLPMLLNDSNYELVNAYEIVRDHLNMLIAALNTHKRLHSEKHYYEIRQQDPEDLTPIQRAARFIYLNKTAFNGLYRVNKYGQFNVPIGKYVNHTIYSKDNLRKVSQILQNAQLFSLDYTEFLNKHASRGDFIYLDPPYHPISKYSDFKRYTKEQFREQDQIQLAEMFRELIKLHAYPVLSNSYSDLILELYGDYNIIVVEAARNINHDGKGRGPIREVLVTPK
jgi:DNA adenine methylase